MTALPPLEEFDAVRFRQELAGLIDEERAGDYQPGDFNEQASQLCYLLAKFYNRDVLEAIKLWERIGSAIATACEQVDDGDLDRLISTFAIILRSADYAEQAEGTCFWATPAKYSSSRT